VTFLLSEDAALRSWLDGMTVTDQKTVTDGGPRQVGVWFGQPDQELRAQAYPYITIDMIDIQRDAEREMRGKTKAEYLGPASIAEDKDWEIDLPIPVNIDYQITTYARHPRHDRELLSQLLYGRLPFRFGQLSLDDGTVRRLEVLDVAKRDATEQAKRLFVNAITVRVSSEIAQTPLNELYKVITVHNDLYPDMTRINI
jgi:hypothetical protein